MQVKNAGSPDAYESGDVQVDPGEGIWLTSAFASFIADGGSSAFGNVFGFGFEWAFYNGSGSTTLKSGTFFNVDVHVGDGNIFADAGNGTFTVDGTYLADGAGTTEIETGTLSVTGDFTQTGGYLALDQATGDGRSILSVGGDYTEGSDASVTVAATSGGYSAVINVSETAYLSGSFAMTSDADDESIDDTFDPLTYSAVDGAFSQDVWSLGNVKYAGVYQDTQLYVLRDFRVVDDFGNMTEPMQILYIGDQSVEAGHYFGDSSDRYDIAELDGMGYVDPNDGSFGCTVMVNWGDGSSADTVGVDRYWSGPGTDVWDNHLYASVGTYTITITVTDIQTSDVLQTATATITVYA